MNRANDYPDRTQASAASGRNGPNIALIAFAVVAVLAVIFFLQNGERTSIDFLVFEKTTTIRWSLLMAIVFGVVLDRLLGFWWRRRKRRRED
ncbi:MAG: hypothetical protein AB7L17_07775 [Ilumatobacteraceae bacterium]